MFWYGSRDILAMFRTGNVIVAGHKGRGKDLLFQYVISRRQKAGEIYAANIYYTKKGTIRPITYYALKNNSLQNFVSDKFEIEGQTFVEKEDYYISDAGVHLPSHEHNKLEKLYPTLPTVYALSRHLGDFNIHCNTQEWVRVWDKLREQGDYFIYCERARVIFGKIAFQRVILYDRYETALHHIQPYIVRRSLILRRASKEDLARAHEFNAKYGYVRRVRFWHIIPKDHYNTREFYKKLYKKEPPKIDKKLKKKKRRHDTHKKNKNGAKSKQEA